MSETNRPKQAIVCGTRLHDYVGANGITIYGKQTVEAALAESPQLKLVDLAAWVKEMGALQDAAPEWVPTTEEKYFDAHNAIFPVFSTPYGFLMGEAADHHMAHGKPRYTAYLRLGQGGLTRFLRSSRPLTIAEFRALDVSRV